MQFTDFNRAWKFFLNTSRFGIVVSHLRTLPAPEPNAASILAFFAANPVKTQDQSRPELRFNGETWEVVYDEFLMIARIRPVFKRWEVTVTVREGDNYVPAPMDHISVAYAFAALLGVEEL
jgi:hypothetical protein